MENNFVKNIDEILETGQRPQQFALQGSPKGCLEEIRIYELIDKILIKTENDHHTASGSGLVESLKSINLAQKLSLKQECHLTGLVT